MARLTTMTTPKWIGFIPTAATIGRRIGERIKIAGVVSMTMPTRSRKILMTIRRMTLLVKLSRAGMACVGSTSFHQPKVESRKSYRPPTIPAMSRGRAWSPPFWPLTSTWVVAVASGNGNLPCMSLTKYLRKGMKNKIPKQPPSNELRKTSRKFTVISGYSACRMYRAGRVKMAPATMMPEAAPIDWMMTFSPSEFLRLVAAPIPAAMMAMGMAASNTWPTLRPR